MRHVGRVVVAILAVLVVQHLFTNGAGTAAGAGWVLSDKGLDGGPVTAIASLPAKGAPVYAGTNEDEVFVSSNEGLMWTPLDVGRFTCRVSSLRLQHGSVSDGRGVWACGRHAVRCPVLFTG